MAKILFVEDDMEFSTLTKDWLIKNGYAVDLVDNAEDALSMLQSYGYDLVVLDWELGGMSGVELCRRYRSQGGTAPVLMLTGRGQAQQKADGLDSGADDYLTKPPDPIELAARVRALLRRPQAIGADVLTVRHVSMDIKSRTVTCEGQKVTLLPREFALLEFLMRNVNQVFSSEELLNRVWTADSDVTPDTVRVCVQRLRGKIDIKGVPSMIRNIYGVGYTMDCS